MVVAIDGPAGTGKSTVAHEVGKSLGLTYLNSGSFYRALTLGLIENSIDLDDTSKVMEFVKKQKLDYVDARLILNGKDVDDLLHQDKVDASVSKVSSIVELRHFVNDRMRQIVKSLNIICEGRDMTTVVFLRLNTSSILMQVLMFRLSAALIRVFLILLWRKSRPPSSSVMKWTKTRLKVPLKELRMQFTSIHLT